MTRAAVKPTCLSEIESSKYLLALVKVPSRDTLEEVDFMK
jgi:hypothetical protein